jgi:hypothetical protein
MFDWIGKQFQTFDPKKITPQQAIIGILVLVVVLGVFNFILNLANTLLPFVIGGAALYFGYQWLTSRSEDVESKIQELKRDEAIAKGKSAPVEHTRLAEAENDDSPSQVDKLRRLLEEEEERKRAAEEAKKAEQEEVQRLLAERRKRLLGEDEG